MKRALFDLNKKAVLLLQLGLYKEAASSLKQALASLRTSFGQMDDGESSGECIHNRSTPNLDDMDLGNSEQRVLHTIPLIQRSPSERDAMMFSFHHDNNRFKLFNRAFTFNIKNFCKLSCEDQQTFATLILLYNIAILHHNRGFYHCDSDELVKALSFYKSVISTVEKIGVDLSQEYDITKLVLASLNNMGQIHSHFFDVAEIQHCLCFIRCIVQSSKKFMLSDNDCLFSSLFVLTMPEQAKTIAPAA